MKTRETPFPLRKDSELQKMNFQNVAPFAYLGVIKFWLSETENQNFRIQLAEEKVKNTEEKMWSYFKRQASIFLKKNPETWL